MRKNQSYDVLKEKRKERNNISNIGWIFKVQNNIPNLEITGENNKHSRRSAYSNSISVLPSDVKYLMVVLSYSCKPLCATASFNFVLVL